MAAPTSDRLTSLPPEILGFIFSYLHDDPPDPPCRKLVPYVRSARLCRVELSSFDQLTRFTVMLRVVPGAGTYVKILRIRLGDGTEEVLAREKPTLAELLIETLRLTPQVKELHVGDWMSSSFVLTEQAALVASRSIRNLVLSVLLIQLNATDFITYRLAALARYPALQQVELVVLPYDPGSSTSTVFDLFPANDPAPSLDVIPISQVADLTLIGPLCDQRVVNILRAFSGLLNVELVDSFASKHVAPLLGALDPGRLRKLRLARIYANRPPIDLPLQEFDWSRLSLLEELIIEMPVMTDSVSSGLSSLPNLASLTFGSSSNPSSSHIRHLLTHRPPSLSSLTLSHITGQVGSPINEHTFPPVLAWLAAVTNPNPASDDPAPVVFPLLDWDLPIWTDEFDPNDAETLFPLARSAGIRIGGTLISAMLTAYVLDKQLDGWRALGVGGDELEGEEVAEMMEAFSNRVFWDALALRYKARLLGVEEVVGGAVQAEQVEDAMDHS
ncbi:SPOSA6832_02175, partial [Sporobolomyces salmonicolor]